MNHRLALRLVAALLPAAALLPGAAHAEKVVTEDAVGDVLQADLASELDEPVWVPAPDEVSTDIVRTVAAYGDTRLTVTVHFRDLLNTRYQETYLKILTPNGSYILGAAREPGTKVDVAIMRGRVGELECRGLRAKFDGGADTISVSVPASCLDEARWVRLGVGATGFDIPEGEMPETVPFFGDDGHRNAIGDTSIGKGPRIRRG